MTPLTAEQVLDFINDGFLRIDNAFPTSIAEEGRAILWKDLPCDPADPGTWTEPVLRTGEIAHPVFSEAANTPVLQNAYDTLVGEGAWLPRNTLGSFVIRFPQKNSAPDTGWHVDASFPGEKPDDYLQWRINIRSKGRALLMLFLFSDVGEKDAPTRIRVGSHLDVAQLLAPRGEEGLSFMELAGKLSVTEGRREVLATGKAGTVYLCHPFLAHAAQDHWGTIPKFMAQPPLLPTAEFNLQREDGRYCPVEQAILKGLEKI